MGKTAIIVKNIPVGTVIRTPKGNIIGNPGTEIPRTIVYGAPGLSDSDAKRIRDIQQKSIKETGKNIEISKTLEGINVTSYSKPEVMQPIYVNEKDLKSNKVSDSSSQGVSNTLSQNKPVSLSTSINKDLAYLRSQNTNTQSTSYVDPVIDTSKIVSFNSPNTVLNATPKTSEEKLVKGYGESVQKSKEFLGGKASVSGAVAVVSLPFRTTGTVGFGLVKGGVNAGKDIVTGRIVNNTFDTATELVSNPGKVGADIVTGFTSNPGGFVGEQVTYGYVTGKVVPFGKKVVKGGKAYVNSVVFEDVASKSSNPLRRATGEPFKIGDIDYGKDIQVTLNGNTADSNLVIKKPDIRSPLGLKDSVLYSDESFLESRRIQLDSGANVKGNGLRFDDSIGTLGVDIVTPVEVTVSDFNSGLSVSKSVNVVEKSFKPDVFGSRTDTSFFGKSQVIPRVKVNAEFINSRNIKNKLPGARGKNVVNAEFSDVKPISVTEGVQTSFEVQRDIFKDLGVKRGDSFITEKNLNGKEIKGSVDFNNVITSNVGVVSEGVKISGFIWNEFKPNTVKVGEVADIGTANAVKSSGGKFNFPGLKVFGGEKLVSSKGLVLGGKVDYALATDTMSDVKTDTMSDVAFKYDYKYAVDSKYAIDKKYATKTRTKLAYALAIDSINTNDTVTNNIFDVPRVIEKPLEYKPNFKPNKGYGSGRFGFKSGKNVVKSKNVVLPVKKRGTIFVNVMGKKNAGSFSVGGARFVGLGAVSGNVFGKRSKSFFGGRRK